VPTQAVVEGTNGAFLFVINADSTATQREITIDRAAGDVTIVSQGVKPGEQVVVDGQLRLNTGTKVQIKPPTGGDQQRAG
jgi:multidrug efflux system membrane fusion protein